MALQLDRSLFLRIASALILMPVVLYALIAGGVFFLVLMGLAVAVAVREWWVVANHGAVSPLHRLAGIVYILVCFISFIYLRVLYPDGAGLALCLILCIWASDTGAYFAGKIIGGPKMAPSISPKKTWAGLFGGLISSAAAFIAYSWYVGPAFTGWSGYDLSILPDAPWITLAIIGASITLTGQAGDLLESYEKRKANMKDSGTLIPGHGGLLDRIDSLLLASPLFILTLKVFGL